MSRCLREMRCPPWIVDTWKRWNVTKCILLGLGVLLSVSGFYTAATLSFADYGQWVICSIFVGMAGILIIAYSALMYLCRSENFPTTGGVRQRRRRVHQINEYLVFFQDPPPPYEPHPEPHVPQRPCNNVSITFNPAGTHVKFSRQSSAATDQSNEKGNSANSADEQTTKPNDL